MHRSKKLSLLTYAPLRAASTLALLAFATGATLALVALTAGTAQARVVMIGGKAYGVTPTPKSAALGPALGRSASRTGGHTQPFTSTPPPRLEYHGGPLMLSSKLYLIFWGPKNSFETNYTEPLIQYATDLHTDDVLTTNEFSVDEQYANAAKEHISGEVEFEANEDVVFDTSAYPPLESSGGCTKAPCVTDTQIRAEVLKEIEAKQWPTDTAAKPEAQYLVYTPEGVASCIEPNMCTFTAEAFCAYHDQIKEIAPSNNVATYSDLPYMRACDSGQAPPGASGNKDADGTLDSEIHEIVESATDPNVESGYYDKEGEEIADKCAYYPPAVEVAEAYGTPLGGSLTESSAFNQLIGGHTYYTQQMWSNAATQTPATSEPAGCVARIGPTPSFTAPASAKTGQIVEFNGSASYDVSRPLTSYEWEYGDGSADNTSGAIASHVYTTAGTYQVALTASDSAGSTDASTQALPIVVTGSTIAAPTASITSPADKQTFTLGQTVTTSFSCEEAAGGPGIESCKDSNGATSPGTLDTSTLGAHVYTTTALSLDGLRGAAQIEYTVVNPNSGTGGSTGGAGTGGGSTSGDGTSGAGGAQSSGASGVLGASLTVVTPVNLTPLGSTPKPTHPSKLLRALKSCLKQPKKKRARCIAAAHRRFGPHRKKRK